MKAKDSRAGNRNQKGEIAGFKILASFSLALITAWLLILYFTYLVPPSDNLGALAIIFPGFPIFFVIYILLLHTLLKSLPVAAYKLIFYACFVPILYFIVLFALSFGVYFLTRPKPASPTSSTPTASEEAKSDDKILIDFSKCTPSKKRIDVEFGSTTIEVVGKENGTCALNYGGEVENPNWDRQLPFKCNVPLSLGLVEFKKGSNGVDLSSIEKYCKK